MASSSPAESFDTNDRVVHEPICSQVNLEYCRRCQVDCHGACLQSQHMGCDVSDGSSHKKCCGPSALPAQASELARMRDIAKPEAERIKARKAELDSSKAAALQKATQRKQNMLELEAQRKLAIPPVTFASSHAMKCLVPPRDCPPPPNIMIRSADVMFMVGRSRRWNRSSWRKRRQCCQQRNDKWQKSSTMSRR